MIVGIGNPLLDMEVKVDKAYLDKWQLKENDAILAEDKHVPLFAEIHQREDTRYAPGGATQNSIRVAQWMMGAQGATAFVGAIGKGDAFGDQLEKAARADGERAAALEERVEVLESELGDLRDAFERFRQQFE